MYSNKTLRKRTKVIFFERFTQRKKKLQIEIPKLQTTFDQQIFATVIVCIHDNIQDKTKKWKKKNSNPKFSIFELKPLI